MTLSVFLSSPVYSHCHPDFVDAFMDTIDAMRVGMGWVVHRHPFARSKGSAQLNLQRSAILETFLESCCDVMVQVDADQWWKPGDMIALVSAIQDQLTDIAGAAVAIKDDNCQPNVAISPKHLAEKKIPGFRIASSLFVPVDRVGAGMLAVSRHAAEVVSDAYRGGVRTPTRSGQTPIVFDWSIGSGELESEDYTFVRRAQELGLRVHALATARIHHIGERVFVTKLDELLMRAHVEVVT